MTSPYDLTIPSSRLHWARIVSDVFSPPVVWMALVVPIALQFTEDTMQGLYWALLYALFICIVPLLFIFYSVHTGRIGDVHMKERKERYRPLFVTLISTMCAWALLKAMGAPTALPLLAVISWVQLGVIMLVTFYWQISMHAMGITGATMTIGIVFSIPTAMLTVPLIMLVGAARLRLKRHTPAQILAGTLVGALVPAGLFLLFSHWLMMVL